MKGPREFTTFFELLFNDILSNSKPLVIEHIEETAISFMRQIARLNSSNTIAEISNGSSASKISLHLADRTKEGDEDGYMRCFSLPISLI